MFGKNANLLLDLKEEYRALVDRARAVASVEPEAFNRRPSEDAWSAAECLDHLIISARLYIPILEEAVSDAREAGPTGRRPDGRTLLGRILVRATEPPPRFRMKTFRKLMPAREHDPVELAEAFAVAHAKLASHLDDLDDLDRKKTRIPSSLDPRLKLSLDDWFAFLAAHARRHLWQAEQALEAPTNDPKPNTA